jgi:NAD(P) transhydrogenase subunit alpha
LPLEADDAQDPRGYARAQDETFYRRQRELLGRVVGESDVVITTAAVPGSRPPLLVTDEMVAMMAPGSVIVDLAAEQGGNCERTRAGEVVVEHDVTINGAINLASTVPYHASQMYARNISAFLRHVFKAGIGRLDLDDPIISETLLTIRGDLVNRRVREFCSLPALEQPPRPSRR